jgi:hypothetical protein
MWRHEGLRPYAMEAAIGLAMLLAVVAMWGTRELKRRVDG